MGRAGGLQKGTRFQSWDGKGRGGKGRGRAEGKRWGGEGRDVVGIHSTTTLGYLT